MEGQNNFNQDSNQEIKSITKNYLKHAVIFLIIMAFGFGGYWGWTRYWSPQAKKNMELQKKIDFYNAFEANYKKALTEDNYGGKTPQETLNMFIDALKKGDMELAAKYFMIDTNESSDTYLTHKKWEEALNNIKSTKKLDEVINNFTKAVPTIDQSLDMKDIFWFSVYGVNGEALKDIEVKYNNYSGVWKLESF
ncbi:MAG: hypothetical protein Athens071426_446 [Parcubacteria group bacterium Athens0714_26]|nr:MAG: hypothetical protein Athens101426_50 [Parcubacteria group bacterium Athens1014_26]TSD02599.1 MAG: hypothetical protein Athens071426_446 [Parcubacteria group bacterium Athens0714_26]